ncbi:MAG: hypothetical protein AB1941_09975 [Gemmatimonadota bacterium]
MYNPAPDADTCTLDLNELPPEVVRNLATMPWYPVGERPPFCEGRIRVMMPSGQIYQVMLADHTEDLLTARFQRFQQRIAEWLALPLHTPGRYSVDTYYAGPTAWRVEPRDAVTTGVRYPSEDGASQARLEFPAGLMLSPEDARQHAMEALRQAAERAAEIRRRMGRFT